MNRNSNSTSPQPLSSEERGRGCARPGGSWSHFMRKRERGLPRSASSPERGTSPARSGPGCVEVQDNSSAQFAFSYFRILIANFLSRETRVVGFTPSNSAAPPGPWTFPPDCSSASSILRFSHWRRSASVSNGPAPLTYHRRLLACRRAHSRQVEVQHAVLRQDERAFHRILQLAHVAGPIVVAQPIQLRLGDPGTATRKRRADCCRKCPASRAMSSWRSRKGGTSTGNTLSR